MPSLSEITSLPQKDRLPAYTSLLPDLYAAPIPGLVNLVDHILNDSSVSLVVGRQVYSDIVSVINLAKLEGGQDASRQVIERILDLVKSSGSASSIANYEEQVRWRLFSLISGVLCKHPNYHAIHV